MDPGEMDHGEMGHILLIYYTIKKYIYFILFLV